MPKISIILPVYNVEKYLNECVDSVRKQTFPDWELIAVDDGSTDSSGNILDRYAKQDERIRVIHKKNGRVWAARNDALEIARGEWVAFLDSDDLLSPYWLAEAMRADKDGVDVIHQQLFAGFEVPANFNIEPVAKDLQEFSDRDAAIWCWTNLPRRGFPVLCFVRRGIIQGNQFKPVIDCKEDSIWLLELSPRMKTICETGYCGYFYRMTPNSLSRKGKRTVQCVAYLDALYGLWESQREWRKQLELDALVSKELRYCADNDVIEWIDGPNSLSRDEMQQVRSSYFILTNALEFSGKWQGQKRYGLAFTLWRRLGWTWLIRQVGNVFRLLRRILNVLH